MESTTLKDKDINQSFFLVVFSNIFAVEVIAISMQKTKSIIIKSIFNAP
ncbi:hypothetical protein [Sutcliffiella horikoshii]|nr:hypothetical protein [Sutcliffiella horikoshii]